MRKKETHFNTFTFFPFFFLLSPGFVVLTRFFLCVFFLLTPVMFTEYSAWIREIARRSSPGEYWTPVAPNSLVLKTFHQNGGNNLKARDLYFDINHYTRNEMDPKGVQPLSTSHRQSSEFYAGESTINYIWQVQCCLKEFVFCTCDSHTRH